LLTIEVIGQHNEPLLFYTGILFLEGHNNSDFKHNDSYSFQCSISSMVDLYL